MLICFSVFSAEEWLFVSLIHCFTNVGIFFLLIFEGVLNIKDINILFVIYMEISFALKKFFYT